MTFQTRLPEQSPGGQESSTPLGGPSVGLYDSSGRPHGYEAQDELKNSPFTSAADTTSPPDASGFAPVCKRSCQLTRLEAGESHVLRSKGERCLYVPHPPLPWLQNPLYLKSCSRP
ncbi:hypothetical protein SKAU_G00015030 [Synaphobranchus kaupii]|uniref:Uncharacterized protein n=1 Tax=Synaphobranchus kaupii TaxID=118154 RepID=A0A9Q1GBW8_SYNKA|nr:hypothetical protein SKAU_G00015030 [Synaphobranchus kaupii]